MEVTVANDNITKRDWFCNEDKFRPECSILPVCDYW